MTITARRVLAWCATALLTATSGCAVQVTGLAVLPATEHAAHPSIADAVMLDVSRMRGITGAGADLTIIPSMDTKSPVDVDLLAKDMPAECRFLVAETATFGHVDDFHKTTFQDPPNGAMISEGAAAYRDPATARGALDELVRTVRQCGDDSSGPRLVGHWTTSGDALRTRPGACGRDYRVKSVVLVEVTFCAFPDSVSDIVMTNILDNVPG